MEKRRVSLSEFARRIAEQSEQYSGYMCWLLTNDRNQDMIVIWDRHDSTMPYDSDTENIAVYFPESVDDYLEIIGTVRMRKREQPSCQCWDTIERLCISRIESKQAETEESIETIFRKSA